MYMKNLLLAALLISTPAIAGQIYWTQPLPKNPSIVISTIAIKKRLGDVLYITRVFDMNVKWLTLWKSYSTHLSGAQLQHQIATHWAAVKYQDPLKVYAHDAEDLGYATQDDEIKWECSSQ